MAEAAPLLDPRAEHTVAALARQQVVGAVQVPAIGPTGWAWVSGTSFAAPHAAGVAALIIATHGGSLHPDQVRTILQRSADDLGKPGNDDDYGAGRVNALRAVLD